ncbi:acyltransferase-domain-containing protein, partial [Butyriboletus roseoflavus]
MSQLLSSTVISAVGLACKAFLNSGLCSITVSGLPILLDALKRERRNSGQGLITVSNHLSTLDDPVTWGILPFENFTNSRTIRWVLGASDIMFTNPSVERGLLPFFRKGQVIETFRGNGIWQPALDVAIEKLNQGHWLHMFGEGKVHQPILYPLNDGIAHLPRFKWGLGRIIMETNVPPLVIPMWLTGFDKLVPEHRPFPHKYLPKMGIQLGVIYGDPIPPDKIIAALNAIRWMEDAIIQAGGDPIEEREGIGRCTQMDEIRSEVTAIIQRAVEDLGRKVSVSSAPLTVALHDCTRT